MSSINSLLPPPMTFTAMLKNLTELPWPAPSLTSSRPSPPRTVCSVFPPHRIVPAELHLSFSLTGTSDSIDVHANVTASATVYCKAYSGSPDTPTAEDLKNEGSSKPFEANVEDILALTGLEANTDYAVYCYAEDAEGQAMLETIASLKQTITTERISFLPLSCLASASVTLSFTVSAKPTSITASVTLSASGTVYCSALTNPSSAPSDSELKESEFKKNVAASIADSIEITGLEANTSYDVYCYGETEDGTPMSETIEELKKTVSTSESMFSVLISICRRPCPHHVCRHSFRAQRFHQGHSQQRR